MTILNALILDTETHTLKGLPIEIAFGWASIENGVLVFDKHQTFNQLYSIGDQRISLGAMATHHIIESDLQGMPHFSEFRLPEGAEYLIGHNINYDINTIAFCGEQPKIKSICTLALARRAFPDIDAHNLAALMYHTLKQDQARELIKSAHRAAADVYMTAILCSKLIKVFKIETMEQLYQLSEQCRIPDRMHYGKHKNTLLKDLPASYVKWLLTQQDVDPYLRRELEAL